MISHLPCPRYFFQHLRFDLFFGRLLPDLPIEVRLLFGEFKENLFLIESNAIFIIPRYSIFM